MATLCVRVIPASDALLHHLMMTDQNRFGPPPASKEAVASLVTVEIEQSHAGAQPHTYAQRQCAVCGSWRVHACAFPNLCVVVVSFNPGSCVVCCPWSCNPWSCVVYADANVECAVCRDCFTVSESVKRLPCEHMFHYPCIMPWLESVRAVDVDVLMC